LSVRREFTVMAGQAPLAVESEGSGPALVCLHAGVCDRRMWRPLAAHLSDAFQVVAYDRRGFGNTPAVDEARSDVEDLCAVLDAWVPGVPVVLVGASRGGGLALDMALQHPERVTALVLLASAVSGDPDIESYPAHIQALVEAVLAAEQARDLERLNALEVRIWLDGPEAPEERITGAPRELLLDMNRIALAAPPLPSRVEPPPAYPLLEAIAQPTLVGWGDLDLPDRVALSRQLAARIPRAQSHEFTGTAHLPSLEQPERCSAVIRAFLANPGAR
jgi:pimeloyl-ACP methyl ester carboxylesterase